MSEFTIGIIIVGAICMAVYLIAKQVILTTLCKAIEHKEYDKVLDIVTKSLTQRVLHEYICDLFRLRALWLKQDEKSFKEELDKDLKKHYDMKKRKELLELYFHQFLLREESEYATILLEKIEDLNDPKFTKYNRQAYEVMINKRSDFIEVMDLEMETEKYSGFALGVLVYMIGQQYLYLNDKENARLYFYNSLTCFHPNSIYTSKAKENVSNLSEELGLEELAY